ncbi:hypothetical protein PN836_009180 [Ningiella sp. W23]|uniref:hypothetical protein n=1 Tax=Ningiella sp. W23 TaxID=3023715 RepID=UPI003756A8CA
MTKFNQSTIALVCASVFAIATCIYTSDAAASDHNGVKSSLPNCSVPDLEGYVSECDTKGVLGKAQNTLDDAESTLGVVLEHVERANVEERLQPFGNTMLGDQIDISSGSVSFSYTDISIPGNSLLPVAVTRTRGAGYVNEASGAVERATLDATTLNKTYYNNELGDWQLDIPRITWKFPVPLSNQGVPQGAPVEASDFCRGTTTYSVAPFVEGAPTFNESVLPHYSITPGMNISLPGKGQSKFLAASASARTGLALPANTLYITKDYWTAKCVNANNGAKGLIVKTPDGTQYLFNRYVAAPATGVSITHHIDGISRDSIIPRVTSTLLVSRVTDKHGNYVD